MSEHVQTIDSALPSAARRGRRTLFILLGTLAIACSVFWPWPGSADPGLVGKWEASPDSQDTYPIQLSADGSAQLIDIWCGGRFTQSYRWTVESNELRLYHASPQAPSELSQVASFFRGSLAWLVSSSRTPARRYRILGRSQNALRLRMIGQGFMNHGEIEDFRRATW